MEKKLVFEVGVEEIPAQYIVKMANNFREAAVKLLKEVRLSYQNLDVKYTPRRLVLLVDGLIDCQPNQQSVVKGPSKKIAFDQNGEATKALLGFLNKNNKTVKDVDIIDDGKMEYVAVTVVKPSKKTVDVLKDGLPQLVNSIMNDVPNGMRWNVFTMKFIRPIRWLLAMYGDEVIPAAIEVAVAGCVSRGHRTLADGEVRIPCAEEYLATMERVFVIVDQAKRKQMIVTQIHDLEKGNGFDVEIDDSLLDEVCNITEYPTCSVGHFEDSYLDLPECIIKDPLKNQQRYFPVYVSGKVTNAFVYARNGGSAFISNVTRGNERVLRPRLEDAEFFFKNDCKTTMQQKADQLSNVVFVDNGGSYADKVRRNEFIALHLADRVGYRNEAFIRQTISIMKADLVSSVVREYTDTQGLVGAVFAQREGYAPEVCTAISEQYLPNYYGDKLPSETLSAIISIADKLDSVMCLSAVGLKPSSSSDPYGLRRQVLGIFNIALAMNFDIDLDSFISECADLYSQNVAQQNESMADYVKFLQTFFYQRLKVFLHDEKGFNLEDLDKVALTDLNVYKSVKKVHMLSKIGGEQWYLDFLQVFNRVVKLVKSSTEQPGAFNREIVDPNAEPMFASFYRVRDSLNAAIDQEQYESAIKVIAEIGSFINSFMVNNKALCDDDDLRKNRLAFFSDFCVVCNRIIHI